MVWGGVEVETQRTGEHRLRGGFNGSGGKRHGEVGPDHVWSGRRRGYGGSYHLSRGRTLYPLEKKGPDLPSRGVGKGDGNVSLGSRPVRGLYVKGASILTQSSKADVRGDRHDKTQCRSDVRTLPGRGSHPPTDGRRRVSLLHQTRVDETGPDPVRSLTHTPRSPWGVVADTRTGGVGTDNVRDEFRSNTRKRNPSLTLPR